MKTIFSLKNTITFLVVSLFFVFASQYLIQKSSEPSPRFVVVIANQDIRENTPITESAVVAMEINAQLKKTQSIFWSVEDIPSNEKDQFNQMQLKKIIGKNAIKNYFRGDQISLLGIQQ